MNGMSFYYYQKLSAFFLFMCGSPDPKKAHLWKSRSPSYSRRLSALT